MPQEDMKSKKMDIEVIKLDVERAIEITFGIVPKAETILAITNLVIVLKALEAAKKMTYIHVIKVNMEIILK